MAESARHRKADLADHLRAKILTLQLRPGCDLDETRLSAEFSLSRTPLREVLRQLAGEGYVSLHDNRGARVADMSHTTLRGFFLAAPMIYGAILQLAATNARAGQIEALKRAQEVFRAALRTGTASDRAMANARFHDITGEMADNVYLLPSFKRLLIDHTRISITFYQPQDAQGTRNVTRASEQHDEIIAVIEAGDSNRAAQLARDHWNLSRDQIERFVLPAGLDLPLGDLGHKSQDHSLA